MDWKQIVNTLNRLAPAGSVITTLRSPDGGTEKPDLDHPARPPLLGARNHGHSRLTNRVVGVNGAFKDPPDGSDQQRRRLRAEGVPFAPDGKVGPNSIPPVKLGRGEAGALLR